MLIKILMNLLKIIIIYNYTIIIYSIIEICIFLLLEIIFYDFFLILQFILF